MPIVVEKITGKQDLANADWPYLLKVYQSESSPLWQSVQPNATTAEQFLSDSLAHPTQHLYAARFNSNYIAAAIVDTDSGNIHAICVRDITRRRGVGKQMLVEIEKVTVSPLRCLAPATNIALVGTLKAAGFIEDIDNTQHNNSDTPTTTGADKTLLAFIMPPV